VRRVQNNAQLSKDMKKIYLIGDIHGDFGRLVFLLKKHNLIDDETNWIGGDGVLVCSGDLTDRGNKGIECIKLFMSLENQAKDCGGDVISTLGNHDALIVAMAFELKGEFSSKYCKQLFMANGGIMLEAMQLSKDDDLMNWMINRPLMCKLGHNLIQHADTTEFYDSMGNTIDQINEYGLQLMSCGKGAYQIFYEMTDCRYWDRNNYSTEERAVQAIEEYMLKHGAKRIFHGHTRFIGNEPQEYFDEKIINLDGSLSIGYRNAADRGFIMEIDYVDAD